MGSLGWDACSDEPCEQAEAAPSQAQLQLLTSTRRSSWQQSSKTKPSWRSRNGRIGAVGDLMNLKEKPRSTSIRNSHWPESRRPRRRSACAAPVMSRELKTAFELDNLKQTTVHLRRWPLQLEADACKRLVAAHNHLQREWWRERRALTC